MHELSLIKTIMERALVISQMHGDRPIECVHLKIGVLRAVVPDALTFAFDAVKMGTVADGALLAWEQVPVEVDCAHCGNRYAPASLSWQCPRCGSQDVDVVHGDELILESVELADD